VRSTPEGPPILPLPHTQQAISSTKSSTGCRRL
jgi:hypothetical protein